MDIADTSQKLATGQMHIREFHNLKKETVIFVRPSDYKIRQFRQSC